MEPILTEHVDAYCEVRSSQISPTLKSLWAHTQSHVDMPQMMVGRLEAAFLGFLVRLGDVKNILEVGTFTGFSALAMAERLPPDGTVTTIDVNPKTTQLAQSYWKQSPHGTKIQGLVTPALPLMEQWIRDGKRFDLIFIDADKENYLHYFERGLRLLSPRGFVAIDNCLWSGKVLDSSATDPETRGIQKLNDAIGQREDLEKVLVPIRDGVFLVRLKS